MAIKTQITKKTIEKKDQEVAEDALDMEISEKDSPSPKLERPTRGCLFCKNKKEPEYIDSVSLRKFISDRSRIMPKVRTGVCSKHQRRLTREIKHARHLALLPFIPSV